MRDYTFDVTLLATITVEAASREEAERIIRGVCEGGKMLVTEDAEGGDQVEGTCAIEGELEPA